jgi:tetratricopeptide (TPR) repeat protein
MSSERRQAVTDEDLHLSEESNMTKLELLRVFIASPSDLVDERKMFPDVIDRVNRNKARSLNYILEAVGFGDALPGGGRPQEIINKDVEECDVFVLLFWKRWGSISGKFSSGTEEEFTIADGRFKKDKVPHLLIYFRDPPPEMIADPGSQLRQVLKFRARIEKQYLYQSYGQADKWAINFESHLSRWLDLYHAGKQSGAAPATSLAVSGPQSSWAPSGPETSLSFPRSKVRYTPKMLARYRELALARKDPRKKLQDMLDLQKVLEAKVAKLETAQNKLRAEAAGLAVEAMELSEKGHLTLAEEKFTKALSLYEEPEVMNNFGFFLWQIGAVERAKKMFERVLNMQSEDKQEVHDAIACNRLGNVYLTTGDLSKAQKLYERALEINTRLKRREGLADVNVSLGNVAIIRGHLKKAEDAYEKALEIYVSLKRADGMADVYLSLGNIHRRRGELSEAEEIYEKAIEINLELNRKERVAAGYGNLGIVYRRKHEFVKAEKMHKKALRINIGLGLKENIADDYAGLGNVYITQDKLAKAEKMYLKALEIDTALGRKEGIALDQNNLGEVFAARNEMDQAVQMWTKAAKLYSELGNFETARSIRAGMRTKAQAAAKKSVSQRLHEPAKSRKTLGK